MQPGDLMMYDGEILVLVLETGVEHWGGRRVRVQICGSPPIWRSPRLCPELLVHPTDLEPVDATG
jgi:hypothetical protein